MVTMTPLLALKALGCGAMLGLAIAFLEACANYTVRRLAVSVLILLTHPLVSLMLGTRKSIFATKPSEMMDVLY